MIPPKWLEAETKEKIDEFMGDGTYDEHGKFDPNNQSRIALPWTVKETTAIFNRLEKEYHVAMDKYTMGTGGGPGDDENFAAWQQRDECNVVWYTNQPSNIYLSVVHSWDKQFGFPFVAVKDPLPVECAIDSSFDFSVSGNDFDSTVTPAQGQTSTAIAQALMSRSRAPSSRREKGITKALEEMSDRRVEGNKMSMELLKLIQGDDATPAQPAPASAVNLQPHQVLKHIEKTRRMLAEYAGEIMMKHQEKESIKASTSDDKKRKIQSLMSVIMEKKKMLKTLQKTLTLQRLQLEALTKNDDKNSNNRDENHDDVSSESGMSSVSDNN